MSLKKTVAIVAAAGALAAISVPAMAFENEFHGSYTFNTIFSNFQDGGGGDFNPAARATVMNPGLVVVGPDGLSTNPTYKAATNSYGNKRRMNNYFEQRARLQYTAKVSDDLKLVTQFELDTRFGGVNDGKYTNTTDSGYFDSDGISLETKHVYLDFNLGKNFKVMTGIMPYKDTIKGVFIDADVPAAVAVTSLGAYTNILGFSRFNENEKHGSALTRLGDQAADMFLTDNIFAINKDTKAAFSYYFLADYTVAEHELHLNTFALSGETKVGPVALSGFAAMQAGNLNGTPGPGIGRSTYYHGYAANVAAKAAVGPGTARTAFLFTSGANNTSPDAQVRGWVSTPASSYNEGGMMILARSTANNPTTTDRYLRQHITNLALLTMGYDANLTDKVFLNTNVGFAWAPASESATLNPNNNGGDFMATEFNLESGYKVNSNLTLRAQAAYAVLGPYYKNATLNSAGNVADPENPYTMRLLASFKF